VRETPGRLGNHAAEDIAEERGGPGKRLIEREEGNPLGLASHLSQEWTAENLQDDDRQRKGAGSQHREQRRSHQGQGERRQNRDDSAAQKERTIADPVGHGRKWDPNQEQGDRGQRIEEADDVIREAQRAHVKVEDEVEDGPADAEEEGVGEELAGRGAKGGEAGERPAEW